MKLNEPKLQFNQLILMCSVLDQNICKLKYDLNINVIYLRLLYFFNSSKFKYDIPFWSHLFVVVLEHFSVIFANSQERSAMSPVTE